MQTLGESLLSSEQSEESKVRVPETYDIHKAFAEVDLVLSTSSGSAKRLTLVKSVEAQSPHIVIVWKSGEQDKSSDVILVILM
ncbi:hypothetical protein TNCV_5049151 [Trichonephila clavipes]|nr:hypothetical protein TNCV_5049151 [Trichonephila clavipes]